MTLRKPRGLLSNGCYAAVREMCILVHVFSCLSCNLELFCDQNYAHTGDDLINVHVVDIVTGLGLEWKSVRVMGGGGGS
jgi:hypothetical protein